MKFGYFDDANKEYVIQNPKTPYPWINYLGTQEFFSLISNTAGGYHFYKDARLRRITRYRYNNVPVDMGGRYFYIKDGETVWSPGWSPVKTDLDAYTCRHGMGYTVISGKKNDISAEVTFFVPQNYNGEIQSLVLKNEGSEAKTIKLFSFIEWCLWNAQDDSTNFQRNFNTGEVEIEGSTIFHKTEYKERRDHYAFYSVNADINGYDTDRESFLGLYNGFDAPQTVFAGAPNMSVADGWSPVASHYIEIKLQPGESKDLVFCLGYVENKFEEKFAPDLDENSTIITSGDRKKNIVNKTKAQAMMAMCDTAEKADKLLAELKEHWNSLLDPQQEIDAAADCIRSLLPQEGTVLVVGLGNSSITPDALGPQVAQHILVTRHLTEELARSLGMGSLRKTAALIPGVLGQTGVESGELTAALVNFIQPSAVIVVDALAAQDYGRLGRTIQISDSGIAPGSGVQNSRKELSRRTLGIPVLSIGVPTVIDAATLAAQLTGSSCEQAHQTAMVTPREIDRLIGHSAKFIALAINKALYPELSLEEIGFLCA